MANIRKINVNGTNYDIADEKLKVAALASYPSSAGITTYYPILDIGSTPGDPSTKYKDTDFSIKKSYTVNNGNFKKTGIVLTASGSTTGGLHSHTLYAPITTTDYENYLPNSNGTLLNNQCVIQSTSGMQFEPTTVTNYIPVVMNSADSKLYAAAPATAGAQITMRVWS